nr:PREDICTED: uncharacterized protein LOC103282400 [Anolis carolinensis]|eukprot:XP_008123278.1 PREDICTED: uncharacterized protein LOC103282400 [Anolis carolinensis]
MSRGQGLSVATRQRWWSPGVIKVLKDALFFVATLLPSFEPLTVGNLLRHRDQLSGVNILLKACFDVAIDIFDKEPPLVQQNARMVIQCAGPPIEFLSGNGECEISVYLLYNEIQHSIRELTPEMYLARLSVRQEPLSIFNMLWVRGKLQSWGVLSPELEGCLDFAIEEFAKEPFCIQDNAHMVVDCGGQVVTFASGNGQNIINIYNVRDGSIHYRIRTSGLWASTARFLGGNKDHTFSRASKYLEIE